MSKFHAYFVRRLEDANVRPRFAYGPEDYVNNLAAAWRSGNNEYPELGEDNSKEEPIPPDFSHESALSDALSQSIEFALTNYQLIAVAEAAPIIFSTAVRESGIVDPIVSSATLISNDSNVEIYGLTEDQYLNTIDQKDYYERIKQGAKALPAATLLSLVATFDTLIVDILGKLMRIDPRRLSESNQTVSVKSILDSTDKEEIVLKIISDELYSFSRGSHEEQERYIAQNFHIAIKDDWKRWPDYIEIFERRNLIAHGERNFNNRYVSVCKRNKHKGSEELLGKEIKLTTKYLSQALDVLVEFAALLSFSLWRKKSAEDERQAFSSLNDAIFKLVSNKRYVVAARIAEFALNLKTANVDDETRRMILVNRASALRHSNNIEAAEKVLGEVDWSATSDLFKICVAAVYGRSAEVASLLLLLAKSETLSAQSFKRWPCFAFVRESEDVQKAFSAAFGVNINETRAVTSDEAPAPLLVEGSNGEMIH